MQSIDFLASLFVLASLSACAVAYGIRLRTAGAVHYARVNAQGSSPLLGRSAMEWGYWCLQPLQQPCMRIHLSPGLVTGVSLVLGVGAGIALACGHLGVGALLATVSALGDALDGMLARAMGKATASGALFDASTDRYTEFCLLAGVAFHQRENALMLGLALLAILGSFMISYGSAKAEAMRVPPPHGAMRRAERAVYLCGGLLLSPLAGAITHRWALPSFCAEAPLIISLALVAVVSNISAALRLRAVARAVSKL